MALENKDFSRLLASGDQTFLNELQRRPRYRNRDGKRRRSTLDTGEAPSDEDEEDKTRRLDEETRIKREKAEEWKQKRLAKKADNAKLKGDKPQVRDPAAAVRDRAKERREGKGEYETVANEFEQHHGVTVEESRFLGGDMDHTHLVKGLDFQLLEKVQAELKGFEQARAAEKAKLDKKKGQSRRIETKTSLGKMIHSSVLEVLHPHHGQFKSRINNMTKCIAQGQRIRGAPLTFQPGFLSYEFDVEMSMADEDVPRFVTRAKEECPKPDFRCKPGYVLQSTIDVLETCLTDIKGRRRARKELEERKKKLKEEMEEGRPEDDIFLGAGGLKPEEVLKPKEKKTGVACYFADSDDFLKLRSKKATSSTAEPADESFQASETYQGSREGYVYKRGDMGLGYYREDRAAPQSGTQQEIRAKRLASKLAREENEAYGELLPMNRLFEHKNAREVDAEEREKNKDKEGKKPNRKERRRQEKGKRGRDDGSSEDEKKDKYATEGAKVYGSKNKLDDRQKKGKLSEEKQWEKIDGMIKEGNVKSVRQMEERASKKQK